MGNFNRGDRSGRGRGSGQSTMYKATCDQCGRECEVPFQPRGDKPVFCSDCFKSQGGGSQSSKRSGGRDFGRRDSDRPSMHQAICDQCGRECEVPFKPTKGKPIYCKDCFGKQGKKDKGEQIQRDSSQQSEAQFNILNTKLDKILNALAPVAAEKPAPKKEATKKPASGRKASKPKKVTKKTARKK